MRPLRTVLATATAAALTGGLLTLASATTAAAAPSGLAGDFNGDGYRDVAIAAPIAKVSGKTGAGYVAVVYGSATGLNTAHRQIISQATDGIPGTPEASDYFGDRLTSGDFDGDGHTDLAAGNNSTPALNIFKGPISRAGKASSLVGVDTVDQTTIYPDGLIAGEVNGDGKTDLLVMGQEETSGGDYRTRSVLYTGDATSTVKAGKKLAGGYAGVIADVDKDGYGDIVTGNFMEKSSTEPNGGLGGAVTVTYGAATGVSSRTPVKFTQDSAGVPGTAEKNDFFGWSLSAGDVNGDGYADIAVGAEQESIGSAKNAGTVTILRGSSTGLTGTGSKSYSQNTANVPGTAESYDHFGYAVRLTDIDNNGRAELVTSASGENSSDGAVWFLKSTTSGITATGSKTFSGPTLGGPTGDAYFGDVLEG